MLREIDGGSGQYLNGHLRIAYQLRLGCVSSGKSAEREPLEVLVRSVSENFRDGQTVLRPFEAKLFVLQGRVQTLRENLYVEGLVFRIGEAPNGSLWMADPCGLGRGVRISRDDF